MSTPIRIKRSAVSGKRPQLTDLQLGELALNTNDGSLFTERDTGGVGIATTVSNLTPWTESYGASSITYLNSVGIGTDNPTAKLDVLGQTELDDLVISGISTFSDNIFVGTGATVGFGATAYFNHQVEIANDKMLKIGEIGIKYFDVLDAAYITTPSGGSNQLIIQSPGITLQDGTGNKYFKANSTNTRLFHNGPERLRTTDNGISISNGIIPGTSNPYLGTMTALDVNTSFLNVSGNSVISGISTFTDIDVDGHTELDDLNVSGVTTFKDDVEFHGVLGVSSITFDKSDNSLKFKDNVRLRFGDHNRLQIYYKDNVNYFMAEKAVDDIEIGTHGGDIIFKTVVGSQKGAEIKYDSSVDLYYKNIKRFATSGVGVTIYNQLDTTNLNVTGVSTFMGKVGIGSAEPNKQLDVIGDSGILVASTTNGGISSTSGISIFLSDNRYDPPNANHDLDQIGEINYKHHDVDTPEGDYSDVFTLKSNNDDLAVSVEGTLLVGVTTSNQGGRVGIGTSIPQEQLDVTAGAVHNAVFLKTSSDKSLIEFENNVGSTYNTRIGSATLGSGNVGLLFETGTSSSRLQAMVIDRYGKVGIGSAIPREKLDVNGNTKLQGNLSVTGITTLTGDVTLNAGASSLMQLKFKNNVTGFGANDGAAVAYSTNSNSMFFSAFETAGNMVFQTGANNVNNRTLLISNTGVVTLQRNQKNMLVATPNSHVKLYYNDTERLSTSGIGITVTGEADVNGNLDVDGHTNLDNVSVSGISTFIGNIDANGDLRVSGISTFSDHVTVLSDSTFQGAIDANGDLDVDGHTNLDNVSVTGILTATSFVGDGSGLTGVTASGTGVIIQHDGSNVGTAGTINFSTNLDVSPVSAGIVTVTASGGSATTINNNANNRLITGSGTANTLEAEAGLTYDGTYFNHIGSGFKQLKIDTSTSNSASLLLKNSLGNFTINTIGDGVNGKFTVFDGVANATRFSINHNGTVGITSDLNVSGISTFNNSINALDIIKGYKYLAAPYSGTTTTLTVTVVSKVSGQHRYHGQGSSLGYVIDGLQSPFFTLTPGNTYRFDQSDISNYAHQIKFYLEADKTTLYEEGVTYNGSAGSSGAYTQIVVSDKTPVVLHYQCVNHGYMGNAFQTNANVVNTNYDALLRGDLNVSGVSTFSGNIDANADLDVDGHTNLDNVSIAGVTTNTGILYANSSVRINTTDDQALRLNSTDNGPIYMRFDRSGSRKAWFGFGSAANNLTIRNEISDGDLYLSVNDGGSTKNAIHIDSSENAKVNIPQDLDVDGHTELDNLNVTGVSTLGSGGSGQTILQYQGSTKLSTENWGSSVTGTLQATNFIKTLNQSSSTDGKSIFLTNTSGNLLEIGHTSSNSFITGHVGNISINAPQVSISTNFSVAGISTFGVGTSQNTVKITHNSGYGLRVERAGKFLDFNGNWGGQSYGAISASNGLRFISGSSSDIQFFNNTVEAVRIDSNGNTNFYKDIDVDGDATFSGNVSIGGTLTYEDVTNVDSVGVITARDGIISRSESTQSDHTNKALQVRNNSTTDTFSVSYRGQVFASNIGIGTDSPTAPLHISGADAASAMIKIEDNNNNIAASQILVQNGGRDLRISAPNDIIFTKLTGGTPILYLENGNAVGIGTDNPGATLDVFGNTILRNDVDIDGNLDVDGHTNLDNVSIAGVSTFAGNIILADSIVHEGQTNTKIGFDGTAINFTSNGVQRFQVTQFAAFIQSGYKLAFISTSGESAYIRSFGTNNGDIQIGSGTDSMAQFKRDGAVELYHNGIKRLETSSVGVSIPQDLDVDGHTNLDNVNIAGVTTATGLVGFGTHITLEDYGEIRLGERVAGGNRTGDFIIRHDPTMFNGVYNVIQSNNGNIQIENRDTTNKYMYLKSDQLQLRSYTGNESFIRCGLNASVTLHYDGAEKLATTNTGINVTGSVVATGADINGDLDVDGHTNLDNVSVAGVTTITSSADVALDVVGRTVLGSNVNLPTFNNSTQLAVSQLSGNSNFVDITILGGRAGRSQVKFGDHDNKETGSIQYFHSDDSLNFFTNGSSTERLIIKSTGNIEITNDLDVDGHTELDDLKVSGIGTFTKIHLIDNKSILLGESDDMRIRHTGSHSEITDEGQGSLRLGGDQIVIGNSDFTETNAVIKQGAAGYVVLKQNGTTRLQTTSSGAVVTGILTATSFEGDGSNLTGIAVTEAPVTNYTISANGSSAYRFNGGGVDETANNPDLYLIRGQKYRFNNTTGSGHPFAIRVSNGGSAYTDGVSGSNQGVQFFTVPYAAPASLVYQCTIHSGMIGNIYIRGGASTANISNNSDNRVITGGSGGNLNGEANLTYDGSKLVLAANSTAYDAFQVGDGLFIGNTTNNNSAAIFHQGGGADLEIGSQDTITFTTGSTAGNATERLRITSSGLVGIGTANPTELIDVLSASNNPTIQVRTTGAGAWFEADSASSGYSGLKLSSGGTQRWLIGSYGTNNFTIKDGGTSGDERFTIKDASGNIGIGSANPGATLDLQSSDAEILLRLNTKPTKNGYLDIVSDANRRGVIRFKDTDGTDRWSIGNGDSDELSNTSFHISSGNSGGGNAKLVIGSSGQIGLGGANYGTSGQVLTSNGSGSAPTWQTVSSGATGVSTTSGTFTVNSGVTTNIDSFAYASNDYKVAEYTLHFMNGANIQAQKLLVMQDGTNVYSNSYGVMSSSDLLVSIGSSIGGGNVYINATTKAGVSGITTYRWRREVQE